MLQNAVFLAKIGADTVENERNFAENLPKIGNYPTGPSGVAASSPTWKEGRQGRHDDLLHQRGEDAELGRAAPEGHYTQASGARKAGRSWELEKQANWGVWVI